MATSPRVAILIGAFYPAVGGGETHARSLACELVRRGIPVQVVTRQTSRNLPLRDTVDGVPVIRLPVAASPRWGKYRLAIPATRELVRLRDEIDIIMVCALRVLGVAGLRAARLTGKRCILRSEACGELSGDFVWKSFHHAFEQRPNPLIHAAIELRNQYYRHADRFLSISRAIHEEFTACGIPEEQIVDIPCGIDTARMRPAEPAERQALRRRLGLPDKQLVAYAGKLIAGKGLEGLIGVWQRLAAERPEAHLVLVGGGGDQFLSREPLLRRMVEQRGLDGRVSFTGYVEAVDDYLRASDLFIFPSERESYGMAPLEAMACGLPVITTRVGVMPEYIENGRNGVLIDPRDEAACFEQLDQALARPETMTAMAAAGRRTVLARCSIGHVAEQHIELFHELMDAPASAAAPAARAGPAT
jgi:glycosyltransferase involved in cell wall biosynthesis